MAGQYKRPRAAAQKRARQDAFLATFSSSGNVLRSCEAIGINRKQHYRWLADDENYAARFRAAEQDAIESLEGEARRRAYEGCIRKKFTKGGDPIIDPETGKQYFEREHSDTLLIFLLKALNPAKYRERVEHTGKDGGPIVMVYVPEKDHAPH